MYDQKLENLEILFPEDSLLRVYCIFMFNFHTLCEYVFTIWLVCTFGGKHWIVIVMFIPHIFSAMFFHFFNIKLLREEYTSLCLI